MEVGEVFLKLINKIWMGNGIPRDWRRGIICPIFKKGEKDEAKNYRGITLLGTAYKIYAGILNERVKKDIEGRLAEGQFGFREGRGAIDAIYVQKYLVNKELSKKRGKLIACFIDLKAAFDKVDRRALMDRLKEMEVKRNLRRRITEIYRETGNMVKIEEERTEEFWTTRGG